MSKLSEMPTGLAQLCRNWSDAMDTLTSQDQRMQFMTRSLPELLENRRLFVELMAKIAGRKTYPDIEKPEMFDNEILLYLDSRRRFSLRCFLFAPGEYTSVHDHSAWGVTGAAFGALEVIRYKRFDDETRPGYAKLSETARFRVGLGNTELTLPVNAGIHKTGNPGSGVLCMVSIYGRPLRRLFVNAYDVEHNRVISLYSPRMKKQQLDRQALVQLETA